LEEQSVERESQAILIQNDVHLSSKENSTEQYELIVEPQSQKYGSLIQVPKL
jgi:hypothetical protein